MFLDFLFPKEAEAGQPPFGLIRHSFSSRYIPEIAKRISGYPVGTTGGEILSRLERAGVLPSGYAEAYLPNKDVLKDELLSQLESGWLKPKLLFRGGSKTPIGAVGYEPVVPLKDLRLVDVTPEIEELSFFPKLTVAGELTSGESFTIPYNWFKERLPQTVKSPLRKVKEQIGDFNLKLIKLGIEPVVKGGKLELVPMHSSGERSLAALKESGTYNKIVSEFDRILTRYKEALEKSNKRLSKVKRFTGEYLIRDRHLPFKPTFVETSIVDTPFERYGQSQFLIREGKPFELMLTPDVPGVRGWPSTHFDVGEMVSVRGSHTGDSVIVQEIQSDWAKARQPKPPPEVVKKWPEHGAEVALVYASKLPGVNKVIFLDEPAISFSRRRDLGSFKSYDKAISYAERRANEVGAKTERVPIYELFPNTKSQAKSYLNESKPLVVHLTDKAKEAIAIGSLLGTGGLILDWETGEWQLQPQPQQQQQKVPESGDWLMRLFGVGG